MPPKSDSTDERSETDGTRRRSVLAGVGALAVGGVAAGAARQTTRGSGGTRGTEAATFDGLDHRAIGDASLSTESGALVASLGSDGSGFATDTERAVTWRAGLSQTVSDMPVGSSITVEAVGTVEGEPDQVAGSTTLTRNESSYSFTGSYDSTVAPDDITVEVMDGDTPQLARPLNNDRITMDERDFWWDDFEYHFWQFLVSGNAVQNNDGRAVERCWASVRNTNGETVPVTVGDDTTSGHEVRLNETASDDGGTVWYTTEMRVTASGLDELVLDDEPTTPGAAFSELPHRLDGETTVQRTPDTLQVGNVDAGDGFEVYLGSVDGFAATFDGVSLDGSGASFVSEGTGTVDETGDRSLGTATLSNAGSGLELAADFAPLGTESVRVEVLRGGTVVGSAVVPAGTVAAVAGGPQVVGSGVLPATPPGYVLAFDREVEVATGDGEPLFGDQVRLFPDRPTAVVDALEAFDVGGSEIGDVVVVDESVAN